MAGHVFITGITGKLGQRLTPLLVAQGHEVVGLTRNKGSVAAVEASGAWALVGSLDDADVLRQGVAGARWILHLAGGIRGPGSWTADRLNRGGTQQLLDAIRAAGSGQLERLLFTSTVAVYGDRSGLWLTEDLPVLPNTRYGESKAAAEALLLEAARTEGLPVSVARVAGVYGPGFPLLMADRIRAGRCWLPGEGRNVVPMVHADDAVAALLRIAEAGRTGGIYNVSDRHPLPIKEFYALVHAQVGGSPARFWSTWVPTYVQERLAWENERIKTRLGRKPNLTTDALRLFRASSRMSVERLETELEFEWQYPDPHQGVAACF